MARKNVKSSEAQVDYEKGCYVCYQPVTLLETNLIPEHEALDGKVCDGSGTRLWTLIERQGNDGADIL